jgi:hypothetical protein
MCLMKPSFDQSGVQEEPWSPVEALVGQQFFDEVVPQADALGLLSDEHFTVVGTLIKAAAPPLKRFRPKDKPPSDELPPDDPDNPTVNFRGDERSNATHLSTMDSDRHSQRQRQLRRPFFVVTAIVGAGAGCAQRRL